MFPEVTEKNDAAVKNIFFLPGFRRCMFYLLKVCPDQEHAFNNVSLSRNTSTVRVRELNYYAMMGYDDK